MEKNLIHISPRNPGTACAWPQVLAGHGVPGRPRADVHAVLCPRQTRQPGEKHCDEDHPWARMGRGQGDRGRGDSLSKGVGVRAVRDGETGSPEGDRASARGRGDVRLKHVLGVPES